MQLEPPVRTVHQPGQSEPAPRASQPDIDSMGAPVMHPGASQGASTASAKVILPHLDHSGSGGVTSLPHLPGSGADQDPAAEIDAYKSRVKELETLCSLASAQLSHAQGQLHVQQAQLQQLKTQQIQIVVLEEQLKMAAMRTQGLEATIQELASQKKQLAQQAAGRQEQSPQKAQPPPHAAQQPQKQQQLSQPVTPQPQHQLQQQPQQPRLSPHSSPPLGGEGLAAGGDMEPLSLSSSPPISAAMAAVQQQLAAVQLADQQAQQPERRRSLNDFYRDQEVRSDFSAPPPQQASPLLLPLPVVSGGSSWQALAAAQMGAPVANASLAPSPPQWDAYPLGAAMPGVLGLAGSPAPAARRALPDAAVRSSSTDLLRQQQAAAAAGQLLAGNDLMGSPGALDALLTQQLNMGGGMADQQALQAQVLALRLQQQNVQQQRLLNEQGKLQACPMPRWLDAHRRDGSEASGDTQQDDQDVCSLAAVQQQQQLLAAATGLSMRDCGAAAAAAAAALAQAGMGAYGDSGSSHQAEFDAAAQNSRLRSKSDAQPNTCVYVGFLGWWVTEHDLVEYFAPYGELQSVRLLISKKSRRSREQAFVEYSSVDQAAKAIQWLDCFDLPALVKQPGCGGLVVRFADRKKPFE